MFKIKKDIKIIFFFMIPCCLIIGLYLGGIIAGVYTLELKISDVLMSIFTAALVFFSMQQTKIIESQLDITLENLKPQVIVRSKDYRDIFVDNAGSTPVFNVKLFAKNRQDEKFLQILDVKFIRPGQPEKIETPEHWRINETVIDYILTFSTKPTGIMHPATASHIMLKKP